MKITAKYFWTLEVNSLSSVLHAFFNVNLSRIIQINAGVSLSHYIIYSKASNSFIAVLNE